MTSNTTSTILTLEVSTVSSYLNSSNPKDIVLGLKALMYRLKKENEASSMDIDQDSTYSDSDSDSDSDDSNNSNSDSEEDNNPHNQSWTNDTSNYNVPFVGTKTSSSSSSPVKPWTLNTFLQLSPNLHELTSDALFPGSPLHTRTLSKTKTNRRLSLKIIDLHVKSLTSVCETLKEQNYDEKQFEEVKEVLKRTLLKGMRFKQIIQQATAPSSNTSTSNKLLQTSTLHLLTSLINLFPPPSSSAPYNPPLEILKRIEMACNMVSSSNKNNSPNKEFGVSFTGPWLFRPEGNIENTIESTTTPQKSATKSTKKYFSHSVCLATLNLNLTLLQTLAPNNPLQTREILLSTTTAGKQIKKSLLPTMLTKILIIPRLISRDLTKSQVADSEIISEYNFVISKILSQLRRVLLSSPSSISSKEFGDFVLPKELLSNLVTLSKDGFKLLKKDVDGIDEVVSEVESKENIEELSLESSSCRLLLLLTTTSHSPYFTTATAYNLRSIARTLTQIKPESDEFRGEIVQEVLRREEAVRDYFIEFFRIQEESTLPVKPVGEQQIDAEGLNIQGNKQKNPKKRDRDESQIATNKIVEGFSFLTAILELGPPKSTTLSARIPPSLNKKSLTKSLLSTNTLLVQTTIELIGAMLANCENIDNPQVLKSKVPDLQSLVSVKAKYNPFQKNSNDENINNNVTYSLVSTLTHYHKLKITPKDEKFNFVSFLPNNADEFSRKPELLQTKIVDMLAAADPQPRWTKTPLKVVFDLHLHPDASSNLKFSTETLLRKIISSTCTSTTNVEQSHFETIVIRSITHTTALHFANILDDVIKNPVHHKMSAVQDGAGEDDALLVAMVLACEAEGTSTHFKSFVRKILNARIKFVQDFEVLSVFLAKLGDASASASADTDALNDIVEQTRAIMYDEKTAEWGGLKSATDFIASTSTPPTPTKIQQAVASVFSHPTTKKNLKKRKKNPNLYSCVEEILRVCPAPLPESFHEVISEQFLDPTTKFLKAEKESKPTKVHLANLMLLNKAFPSLTKASHTILSEHVVKLMTIFNGLKTSESEEKTAIASLVANLANLEDTITTTFPESASKNTRSFVEGCFELGLVEEIVMVIAVEESAGEVLLNKPNLPDRLLAKILKSVDEIDPDIKSSILTKIMGSFNIFETSEDTASVLEKLMPCESEGMASAFDQSLGQRSKLKGLGEDVLKSEMRMLQVCAKSSSSAVRLAVMARIAVILPRALKKGEQDPKVLVEIGSMLAQEALTSATETELEHFNNLALSLLKYGLGADDNSFGLNLLILLVEGAKDVKSCENLGHQKILLLTLNHSNFCEAVKRCSVLKLLHLCLSLQEALNDEITSELLTDLLQTNLKNHQASMATADQLTRKIVRLLDSKFSVAAQAHEMVLGGGGAFGEWGSFVASIDVRRVNATLGKFPIDEGFEEDGEGDLEDSRYSPAFVIPLAVSCLEAFMPSDKRPIRFKKNADEEEGTETDEFKAWAATVEVYVTLVRRFCDGVVPLTLCSLSSKDALVRKLAWIAASMLLRGLEAGGSVSGWSSRPQQHLVVESVLRGLHERRQNVKINEGDDFFYVPVLPAVTAVFLAQSFQVMNSPSSPIYNAVNSYFLSNNNNVFPDLNALPGGLLLSSPEAVERAWILKLIIDGTRSPHDHQVASRRFAPALCMSAVDAQWASQSEKRDSLAALEGFLKFGELAAAKSLIENNGFLSWLAMVGGKAGEDGWGVGVKLKWLETCEEAMKQARLLKEALVSGEGEGEDGEGGGEVVGLLDIEISRLKDCAAGIGGDEEDERVVKKLKVFC
ncbi:hypothetical protein TrLO_g7845 [Triparma laevis f. longispina]|uniref:URB1 C-terminal domain-containing protein n=1 Tax=Triparma laevis f. longispina TaxID=1714387 RepID=A0A9W7FNK6_9STRA|nr:hypothetical protein TrLO_g7845 [Triparma laevis f. longispina]